MGLRLRKKKGAPNADARARGEPCASERSGGGVARLLNPHDLGTRQPGQHALQPPAPLFGGEARKFLLDGLAEEFVMARIVHGGPINWGGAVAIIGRGSRHGHPLYSGSSEL